ncbi:MAG: hypothetical protein RLZZ210_295 [Pseudomonadota bacterium]|jgi:hypothetical protein
MFELLVVMIMLYFRKDVRRILSHEKEEVQNN